MFAKLNLVCKKSNHQSKSIEILCFDTKCRNDPFMCLKCLPFHSGHLLVSIDNLIEGLEKHLSGIDRNAKTIAINKVKESFNTIHKHLENTENLIIQTIENQDPVNILNSILTNFKSKEYIINDLNHIFETCRVKGEEIIYNTNNSNLISFPKLEKFLFNIKQEIQELKAKYLF